MMAILYYFHEAFFNKHTGLIYIEKTDEKNSYAAKNNKLYKTRVYDSFISKWFITAMKEFLTVAHIVNGSKRF